MKKIRAAIKQYACAALICLLAFLAGCSYTVMPKNVPPIKGLEPISLKEASIIVANAEKDSSESAISSETGGTSAFRANRQAWSKMLVEAVSMELAKRGARLSSKAPLTLTLALPIITFSQAKDLFRFTVKVSVSSSLGWSKTYEGTAESERGGFESITSMGNRLAGLALSEAVKAMLTDPEFLTQLPGKK